MKTKRNSIFYILSGIIVYSLTLPVLADGPDIQWQKTFGGIRNDEGHSVQQTSDGGFIITGLTQSFSTGCDIYLIKTDSAGDLLWQKTFGGYNYDSGHSVQQTSEGGFIIVGNTVSFGAGSSDVYLIKTDSNGESQWQKTFGGLYFDYGRAVQQTTDGGFIITGGTSYIIGGDYDVYLIKTDSNGVSQWQKTFGGNGSDSAESVQQTTEGGFIIAGRTYSFGAGSSDVYLIKTNSDGNSLWQKTFGGISGDLGYEVRQTIDDGFIITGSTVCDTYLVKTDSAGNLLWQKNFGGSDLDYGYSVQQTYDGGFIIAGETISYGAGNYDVYIIKTDPNGESQWEKTFGGSGWDSAESIQQTVDGGFVIAGSTNSFGAGDYNVYLIKLAATADIPGDLDYDRDVDSNDLERFASKWLNIDCSGGNIWCSGADLDKGGYVDFVDLAIFCDHWLEGVNP